jgi:hypothetical protein
MLKIENKFMKNTAKIFLFSLSISLISPFMFSVVRAENMEDKITENKTVVEKVTETVKDLFKTEDGKESKVDIKTDKATETKEVAASTKDILENIKKQVKENKSTTTKTTAKVTTKKTKKIIKNSCDIFLEIVDKSYSLDDKINSSILKIDNLEKEVEKEFSKRETILESLKNVLSSDMEDKELDAQNEIYKNLTEAKEFYVDLDDKNQEIISYIKDNLCDKIKNTEASDKNEKIDELVTKEKLYRKTLTAILKEVVLGLKNEVEKVEK